MALFYYTKGCVFMERSLYLNPDIGFIGVTERDIGVCDMDCHISDLSNNAGIPNSNSTTPSKFVKELQNLLCPDK